jgi:prepilin-type N-terminal cleavage/methylation domain-containing protein
MRGAATRTTRDGEQGFTLVEVMIAVLVLAVALLGTISTVVSADALERRVTAQEAAERAASDALEKLRNGDLPTQLAFYQAHTTFTDNGQTVSISFPASELATALPLLDASNTCFLDANADGQFDFNAAKAAAPGMLPVRIVVGTGPNQVVLHALVMKR